MPTVPECPVTICILTFYNIRVDILNVAGGNSSEIWIYSVVHLHKCGSDQSMLNMCVLLCSCSHGGVVYTKCERLFLLLLVYTHGCLVNTQS